MKTTAPFVSLRLLPWCAALLLIAGVSQGVFAASLPDRLNYQGVLRDAADAPLDGDFEMIFRFFSAETGGQEILIDRHTNAAGGVVPVTKGLFNTQLGGGDVIDGSGAGTYTSLAEVFRDYAEVYLEIEVKGETLTPRVQVISAAYALNADHLDGHDGAFFLNTSNGMQTKAGPLTIDAPGATAYGIEATGKTGGGYFQDGDNSALARTAWGNVGVYAEGTQYGAKFEDSDDTGYAYLGYENHGISSGGSVMGGRFSDTDGSGVCRAGYGNYGVEAEGSTAGGHFFDTDGSGDCWVGDGDYGVYAVGNITGGYFKDSNHTGYAYVGYGNTGIYAKGSGAGAEFWDTDSSGRAFLGRGDTGVEGGGSTRGGYFWDTNGSGYADVAVADNGINAYGDTAAGYFRCNSSGVYTRTSWGSSSTAGNGAKNFIQNHPLDGQRVIVYSALEGDEVGTYTRGTARLIGGEARVPLGETFKWVTNPDIGLTAHLTPIGGGAVLYVAEKSTRELVVRCRECTGDVAFDYIVFGLRAGFEKLPTVRVKQFEAQLPDMSELFDQYEEHPELRATTPLERFRSGAAAAGIALPEEMTASRELVEAIGTVDVAALQEEARAAREAPDAEEMPTPPDGDMGGESRAPLAPGAEARPGAARALPSSDPPSPSSSGPGGQWSERVEGAPGVVMESVDPVEAGQVLAFDPRNPGRVMVAVVAADPAVVGVALGTALAPETEGETTVHEARVALTGLVECRADAGYGAIRVGDLLTASPTPGHAMRALEIVPGTILGKAAEPLEVGMGTIKVLVMPR